MKIRKLLDRKNSSLFLLILFFAFCYLLNFLMPLAFGDDYLYAFIWQGKSMTEPISENAIKISCLKDLIQSQISFYFTWSGRVVNNTLSQLFVWVGKDIFNICNALVCVLLVMEIYWCSNKGKVTFNFNIYRLSWIMFLFWLLTPAFPSVVFWLVGACHYLWPAMFLTGFLIPYIRKYYFLGEKLWDNKKSCLFMFILGVIAGDTNENSICWILLTLFVFILYYRKTFVLEKWIYTGFIGLAIGYSILMLSSGNFYRLVAMHGTGNWLNYERFYTSGVVFTRILVQAFLPWMFCLYSFSCITRSEKLKQILVKDILLIKILNIIFMGMSLIMFLSPEFHLRSAFPGSVYLFVAVGILLRIQEENDINFVSIRLKKAIIVLSIFCFIISSCFTLKHLYKHVVYNNMILSLVDEAKGTDKIIVVEPFQEVDAFENFLTGYHTMIVNIKKDVNFWGNVAFSRYNNIKGIYVLESDKNKDVGNIIE